MTVIKTFNNLQGKSLTRGQVRKLINEAKKENVNEIVNKLSNLLRKYPGEKGFEFTSVKPVNEIIDFEALGIPYLSSETENQLGTTEIEGLGKRVSNDSIYQMVTDRIIETIDKGTGFWSGKHNAGKGDKTNTVFITGLPVNYSDKKAYRGINSIVLSYYPEKVGVYTDHNGNTRDKVKHIHITDGRLFWMTMKQIKEKKGKLKKGSKSNQAVFYNWVFLYKGEKITEQKYKQLKAKFGCSPMNKTEQCDELKKIAFLRYYNVFNERDIEGIDFDKAREKQNENKDQIKSNEQKILAADLVIKNMPEKPQLKIKHLSSTESPHYSPMRDYVMMPQKEQYDEVAEWYGTAFHEFVHSTGHTKRLGRFQLKDYRGGRNGNNAYALEELVAEIGAAFLNAESGIMLTNLKNNASYIKGWATHVKKELQNDNKVIFKAAGQAQKAADYILNFNKDGDPAYWVEYEKIQKEIKVKGAKQKAEKEKINSTVKKPVKYTDQTGLKSEILKNGLWTNLLSSADIRFISQDEVKIFKHLSSWHFTNGKTEIVISDGKTRRLLKKRSRASKEIKELYNNSLQPTKTVVGTKPEKLEIISYEQEKYYYNVNKTGEIITVNFKDSKKPPKQIKDKLLSEGFKQKYDNLFVKENPTGEQLAISYNSNLIQILNSIYVDIRIKAKREADKEEEKKATGKKYAQELEKALVEMSYDKTLDLYTALKRETNNWELTEEDFIKYFVMMLESDLPKAFVKKQKLACNKSDIPTRRIKIKPIKQAKAKKLSFRDKIVMLTKHCAAKDPLRPVMELALHKNNKLIASDASILVVLNVDEREDGENVTYTKTGRKVDISNDTFGNRYPNYEAVIPKDYKNKISSMELKPLLEKAKGVSKASKYFANESKLKITINDVFFNPEKMHRALLALYLAGVTRVNIEVNEQNKALVIKDADNENQLALVMPVMPKQGNYAQYSDFITELVGELPAKYFGVKEVAGLNGTRQVFKQSTLFGKKKSLGKALILKSEPATRNPKAGTRNPLVKSINHRPDRSGQNFIIGGDIGKFLGDIEIKPFGSVACTLDAPQGAGKTRFFFQVMNELAKNYKVLFISLEEHPESNLFQEKVSQYIEPKNQQNIDTIGELERGKEKETLNSLIPDYDCVFIDSWNKIYENAKLDFDNDLRKAFNSKLMFAIFQRTTNGTMRGGSKAGFDGDIIMKVEKGEDFKTNFVFHDKNRYHKVDLIQLKYNVYKQMLEQPEIGSEKSDPPTGGVNPEPATWNLEPLSAWNDATITI